MLNGTPLHLNNLVQTHKVRIEYKRLQTSGDLAGKCPIRVFYDNDSPAAFPTAEAVCGPDPVQGPKLLCSCLSTMLPSLNKRSRGPMKGYAWIGLTASTGSSIQTHQIANLAFSGSPKVNSIVPWAGPIEARLLDRLKSFVSHVFAGRYLHDNPGRQLSQPSRRQMHIWQRHHHPHVHRFKTCRLHITAQPYKAA